MGLGRTYHARWFILFLVLFSLTFLLLFVPKQWVCNAAESWPYLYHLMPVVQQASGSLMTITPCPIPAVLLWSLFLSPWYYRNFCPHYRGYCSFPAVPIPMHVSKIKATRLYKAQPKCAITSLHLLYNRWLINVHNNTVSCVLSLRFLVFFLQFLLVKKFLYSGM